THSPRKTYAKLVYENSNNDLVVTQQALRHSDIQSTLYYLDTVSDNVTSAMPDFGFGDFDTLLKTSNSKVIEMPKPNDKGARRKQR
nr:hypothetical protein [bacterium]